MENILKKVPPSLIRKLLLAVVASSCLENQVASNHPRTAFEGIAPEVRESLYVIQLTATSPRYVGEVGPVRLDMVTEDGGIKIYAYRIPRALEFINITFTNQFWPMGWDRLCDTPHVQCSIDWDIGMNKVCIPADQGWHITSHTIDQTNYTSENCGATSSLGACNTIANHHYICITGSFEIATQIVN